MALKHALLCMTKAITLSCKGVVQHFSSHKSNISCPAQLHSYVVINLALQTSIVCSTGSWTGQLHNCAG